MTFETAPRGTSDGLEPESNYDSQYLALRGQAADESLMREFMDRTTPDTAKPALSPEAAPQAAGATIKQQQAPEGQPETIATAGHKTAAKPGFLDLFKASMQVAGTPARRAIIGGVLDAVRSTAETIDDVAMKLDELTGLDEKLGLRKPGEK